MKAAVFAASVRQQVNPPTTPFRGNALKSREEPSMSVQPVTEIGAISWTDLTVPNAEAVRDFYAQVVGWKAEPLDMGGYSDYCMNAPATGETKVGICHAKGENADIPPQWLVYINVENLTQSVENAKRLGGKVVREPRDM